MCRLKVKNFGPIKEGMLDDDGFINIDKVTLFIGAQGSGKSTVTKLLTTCMWIEKALNRGDIEPPRSLDDFQTYCKYFGMFKEPYFRDDTYIEYEGNRYLFRYNPPDGLAVTYTREVMGKEYTVPKIMYIPAERNFLMALEDAMAYKRLPEPLAEFAGELRLAQRKASAKPFDIPINNIKYSYDERNDVSRLIGSDYELELTKAASGFQSAIPIFLVTKYLSEVVHLKSEIHINNMSPNQRLKMNDEIFKVVSSEQLSESEKLVEQFKIMNKFINKAFINIVEEPEQNLFPSAQRSLLHYLLEYNNIVNDNKLILTTHSPYIINYISLAVEAYAVWKKIKPTDDEQKLKALYDIVPLESMIPSSAVNIYQMKAEDGTIQKLVKYDGIPSDDNFLNHYLQLGNELFDDLLALDQSLT